MITTFLHDNELNQPLPESWMDKLLAEVREKTGGNYQLISHHNYDIKWAWQFAWPPLKNVVVWRPPMWVLYRYVGGCGPWQVINFYREESDSSINTTSSTMDLAIAFLYGILARVHDAKSSAV